MKPTNLIKYIPFISLAFILALFPRYSDAVTNISSCGTLSSSSETYILTGNISHIGDGSNVCLRITASNITVDLASSTIEGHILGNGSSTAPSRNAYSFTLKNGRVNGNVEAKGVDGAHGGNGGNATNASNSVDLGGTGNGGTGGAGGLNGDGTSKSAGSNGEPGYGDEFGGSGGVGGAGGNGQTGSNGGTITLENVQIYGNVNTGGGIGGNGGNGGNGGHAGLPDGTGGDGGAGGSGANGGRGRDVVMTNSTIHGTLLTSSGRAGHGGNGGNGGDANVANIDAFPGNGGGPGARGATAQESGLFYLTDSNITQAITTTVGPCGDNGAPGTMGTSAPETALGISYTYAGCGGVNSLPANGYTVVDNPPVVVQVTGDTTVEVSSGANYIDLGALGIDRKDGNLSVTGTLDHPFNGPGTYVLTYTATDSGTTLMVNGISHTYQTPQSITGTRRIIVKQNYGSVQGGFSGGGSSGGSVTTTPSVINSQSQSQVSTSVQKQDSVFVRFEKVLQSNMKKDADVKNLQKFLNNIGFPVASKGPGSKGSETDFFGAQTRSALRSFQQRHGIYPATGTFDKVTQVYVNALLQIGYTNVN